jgi:hypothetical protein
MSNTSLHSKTIAMIFSTLSADKMLTTCTAEERPILGYHLDALGILPRPPPEPASASPVDTDERNFSSMTKSMSIHPVERRTAPRCSVCRCVPTATRPSCVRRDVRASTLALAVNVSTGNPQSLGSNNRRAAWPGAIVDCQCLCCRRR